MDHLRTIAAATYLGGDLRIRRQCPADDFALCRAAHLPRLAVGGRALADFPFWGYQPFIVLAASGYVLGITQGKEYAEPEWYVDLWLTVVWVVYLVVFLVTLMKRKDPHIYVANWFYLAFIVTVAVLHIGNGLACPSRSSAPRAIRCWRACRTR